ncbi:hypothetical protein BHE90_015856 [Fusarium euwallaceae]|uniref:Uncharacterized protein n=1 Tax=Fusarium euwallaceae TaxID=1147111 RepID=A0A430L272_9HYPO|nr:hypothetical protein BHE90_015856 [Fusarium euwallaceae]
MRKRGSTAIKKNYQFGKDCNTIAILLYYNKIHGFWDGSGHVPEGESLPDNTNEVIKDVMQRQVISDGELVIRPARERKQPTKTKPTKTKPTKAKPRKNTKPAPAPAPAPVPARTRNLRSLRSRKRQPENGPPMSSDSPAPTQIMAAGSETGADDRDASIWDIPSTPSAEATIEVRGDDDMSVDDRDEVDCHGGNDGGDNDDIGGGDIDNSSRLMGSGTLVPHCHRADLDSCLNDVTQSPPAADRDAEGELCGWRDEPLVPMGSWANDVMITSEPGNEPAPMDFTTMRADEVWMPSAMVDFGDAQDFVDASGFPSLLDYDFGDMGSDIDMNVDSTGWLDQFSVPPGTEIVPPIAESMQPIVEIMPAEGVSTESIPAEIMPPSLMDLSSAYQEAASCVAFSEHEDGRGNSGLPNTVTSAVTAPQPRAATPDAERRMHGAPQRATVQEGPPTVSPTSPGSTAPLPNPSVTVEKNWQQPIYVTRSQLLAVITQSLQKMNDHENTEWDSSSCKDVGWSMRDHHGFDTPIATPVY